MIRRFFIKSLIWDNDFIITLIIILLYIILGLGIYSMILCTLYSRIFLFFDVFFGLTKKV